MNFGFFGFPAKIPSDPSLFAEYDSSGTYVIPKGCKLLMVFATQGGSGGLGGTTANSGVAVNPAQGGSGGTPTFQIIDVDSIGGAGTTLEVTIGAGGAACPGLAGGPQPGLGSGEGGLVRLSVAGRGDLFTIGWQNSVYLGIGNTGSTAAYLLSMRTGTSGYGQPPASGNLTISDFRHTGGPGGGGLSAANATSAGGSLSKQISAVNQFCLGSVTHGNTYILPGAAGGGNGLNSTRSINGSFSPGMAGTGGGSSTTTNGGRGGDGYRGGAGGGGGAARTGFTGGDGGRGGNAYLAILAMR
jgi:hypothetical protein